MSTVWIVEPSAHYLAGQDAPSGCYCRVDVPRSHVVVHEGGPLPASYDGQRALYVRVRRWSILRPDDGPPTAA